MSSKKASPFAGRLLSAMDQNQITASELARRVSVTPTAVWNWQQGNAVPRSQTLSAIAGVLRVSEEYLLTGAESVATRGAPRDSSVKVREVLDNARREIAQITGFEVEQVKLNLEVCSS